MEWYENYDAVLDFGRALVASEHITSPQDLLYYFENPLKWEPEHDAWVAHGSPTTEDEEAWNLFITALERIS